MATYLYRTQITIMKLSTLKKKILKDQVEFRFEMGENVGVVKEFKQQFQSELDECKNVLDLIQCLGNYGYDRQGAIEIIFGFLVDCQN